MFDTKKIVDKTKELAKKSGDAIKDTTGKSVDSLKEFVKDTSEKMNDSKNKRDFEKHAPLTKEEFDSHLADLPKMIRIMDIDKHKDIEVCKDAFAYLPVIGSSKVLEIERKKVGSLCVEFYPNQSDSIFYKYPYSKDGKIIYINIAEYFDYLKKEKISELNRIAHSLGAKHVKIVFQEQNKLDTTTNIKAKINADISTSFSSSGEIASDEYFEGSNEPVRPELVYYKNVSDVEDLINMCMDKKNRPTKKEYVLKYSSSLDINVSVASDIDSAVSKLGVKALSSISVKSKVEKENSTNFRYLIEF